MAAYSSYRHVELDKIGFGKRSVMKPPGGECHDIFGADFNGSPSHQRVLKPPGGGTSELFTAPNEAESPRRVRNHQSSMIMPLGGGGDTSPIAETDAPSFKPGNSHNRIFGPPEPAQLKRNAYTSQIVLGDDNPTNVPQQPPEIFEEKENECDKIDGSPNQGGNPVTGEGYESPKANGNAAPSNGSASPANPVQLPLRNRVPPGGYSSGLW